MIRKEYVGRGNLSREWKKEKALTENVVLSNAHGDKPWILHTIESQNLNMPEQICSI